MAKFELNLHNPATGEVETVLQRSFMPVSLYIRFQKFSEKVVADELKSDAEFYESLKSLFLETFPELTEKDYEEKVDTAEALLAYRNILSKATEFTSPKKNA